MTKIEVAIQNIQYRIEFEEENIESRKKCIMREMDRFSHTSGQWLAQYGKDIEESQKKIRELHEQIKMLNWVNENVE